ncbi:family 43 glycosylhydrolase [Rhizomicrobium electricum]|uniref:Uncharacterized protein n=1 Tax=Rhizomicrobium electricum TaxID=480070 RepID=A0ABP3PRM9_9PROT|nr:family 43 glycosylhydrolase [Rhizomicrobium electricum]NIJ49133.1 hypothetical protein [Rhizomicrobium electricum]
MKIKSAIAVAALISTAVPASAQATAAQPHGNPIIPHIFVADPSAHVWPKDPDTVWVYTSTDQPGTNSYDTMRDYHAFSTKDLVNWVDHGRILSVDNVPWAASHAWAPDAVYYGGKYYLLYPMKEKTLGVFMVGLGVSDRPEGPFQDTGYIKGSEWGQDPALFVDDNGQPYLYWGHDFLIYGAKLSKDLRSVIAGSTINLTSQLADAFEAPWLNKINGKYYLSYAGLHDRQWPEALYYAVADNPLGPYTSKGVYLPAFGPQTNTIHGAIIPFKGEWISFYHGTWSSAGNSENRSVMADYLTIRPDGIWAPIVPTVSGVTGGKNIQTSIWLEAESGVAAGGRLTATSVESKTAGYSGRGYVTGFPVKPGHDAAFYAIQNECNNCVKRASVGSVQVLAQVAFDQDYRLKVRYAADQDTRLHILVNTTELKRIAPSGGSIVAKATAGKFEVYDLGVIHLHAGDNTVELRTRDNMEIKIDAFELSPQYNR